MTLTTILLTSLILIVTVALALKAKGRKAPAAQVIVLYGLGLVGVLLIGGLVTRWNAQRTYDNCVVAVNGRNGVRRHFDFLYGYVAHGGDPNAPIRPQTEAFIAAAQADLDQNLPARKLEECGQDPGL